MGGAVLRLACLSMIFGTTGFLYFVKDNKGGYGPCRIDLPRYFFARALDGARVRRLIRAPAMREWALSLLLFYLWSFLKNNTKLRISWYLARNRDVEK